MILHMLDLFSEIVKGEGAKNIEFILSDVY